MYGKIDINGNEMELLANAATPYRVKQVFNIDIMKVFFDAQTDGGVGVSSILPQLCYVMNAQALKKDMSKLNMNSFLDWCEEFGAFDLVNRSEEIINIYLGNQTLTSTAKKNKDR